MLTVGLLFEDYVTRGQVGSNYGRLIGAGLGALGGGLGLGALGYYLSLSDDGSERQPATLFHTTRFGKLGMIGGGLLGALGGSVLGSRIGQKMSSNPEPAAGFSKKIIGK